MRNTSRLSCYQLFICAAEIIRKNRATICGFYQHHIQVIKQLNSISYFLWQQLTHSLVRMSNSYVDKNINSLMQYTYVRFHQKERVINVQSLSGGTVVKRQSEGERDFQKLQYFTPVVKDENIMYKGFLGIVTMATLCFFRIKQIVISTKLF